MNYDDSMKKRLKRIEGQIRGILRMMEEGKHCKEVITQITAVRSAMDKASAYIVASNLEQCILEEQASPNKDHSKLVEEAVKLLIRSK